MTRNPDRRGSSSVASILHRLPWFSRRRSSSLTARLMTLAMLWAVSIFALATFGLWWTAEQVIKDNVRQKAHQWLGKFNVLGTTLLVSGDPSLFEPIREHINQHPEIVFLRFVAADGKREIGRFVDPSIDASLFTPFTGEDLLSLRTPMPGEDSILEQEIPSAGILRVSMPAVIKSISRDGLIAFSMDEKQKENIKTIGFVDLGIDLHPYRSNLTRHVFLGSMLILVLFLITTIIGREIIKRALQPLSDLQIPLDKLARGETDIQIENNGVAEIVAIGNALSTTITALKERDRELHRLATYDTLTGLLNRHSFNRELEREKARVLLEEHTSALLFIDLDKFKEVNDTVGHAGGDNLLSQVAQLLSSKVRSNDIVARLGGDEFTVILKDIKEEQAAVIAAQIGAALRDFSFSAGEHTFKVHCSIGITLIDSSQTTTTELLSEADTACHEAKNQGRDCYKFFREIAPEEILHLEGKGIKEQIERALEDERFALSFIPIKDVIVDRIAAFETMVQMSSNGQEVPARAFFLAAERFDLAPRIDRWVIGKALRQLGTCSDNTHAISINLSGRTLQQDDIISYISDCLAEHQLDPARVSFEIPERAVLDSVTQTKNFMEKLKEIGCGIIIDDFGVSLNSLHLLKHLPVNQLKLEASLVSSSRTSTFSQAVISSIVRIARELDIEIVAKGVMRRDEATALCNLGVHYLQGHEIGQPCRELPNSVT